jgi:hypothetical protein
MIMHEPGPATAVHPRETVTLVHYGPVPAGDALQPHAVMRERADVHGAASRGQVNPR